MIRLQTSITFRFARGDVQDWGNFCARSPVSFFKELHKEAFPCVDM